MAIQIDDKICYYFSGVGNLTPEKFEILTATIPFRLLSCHGSYVKIGHDWAAQTIKSKTSKTHNTLLLDSGAFTAWNQGHEVKLEDLIRVYYDFMDKYWQDLKEIYLINLDKIPGSPGRTADKKEIDECIKISDSNYEILLKWFGNRVLPVYHQGESESRLSEIASMADYICISPRNDLSEKYRVSWSREVHSKLPKNIKTHGLAATGIMMMNTVPWTSVDSATWVFKASTGVITLVINGKMVDIAISEKSPNRFYQGQHITNFDQSSKLILEKRICDLGYTIEDLAIKHTDRMSVTIEETQHWVDNYYRLEPEFKTGIFDL